MKYQMLIEFIAVVVATFLLSVVAERFLIPVLKSRKVGQKILDIGPRWHKSKEGTPTMGGICFILAMVVVSAVVSVSPQETRATRERRRMQKRNRQ